MQRNFLLLILVLIFSYVLAPYLGSWYDKFSPQYGSWLTDKDSAVFFVGDLLVYTFLVSFLFELFGFGNKKRWIILLLIPPAWLWLSSDVKHIYIPIILGLIAFGLAWILKKLFFKQTQNV